VRCVGPLYTDPDVYSAPDAACTLASAGSKPETTCTPQMWQYVCAPWKEAGGAYTEQAGWLNAGVDSGALTQTWKYSCGDWTYYAVYRARIDPLFRTLHQMKAVNDFPYAKSHASPEDIAPRPPARTRTIYPEIVKPV